LDDDTLLRIVYEVFPRYERRLHLVYERSKDGIEVDIPTFEYRELAKKIIAEAQRTIAELRGSK
jgi:hypothetical protein